MGQQGTLRLFTFRPARVGFDGLLRDTLVPDLVAFPQLLDLHVGRQGPDETGTRLVASVWASREAMIAAVGEDLDAPAFHPEYLVETSDRVLEVLELMEGLRFDSTEASRSSGIVRVARGRVRAGALELYRDMVLQGTCADVRAGHGPASLYLARWPDDERFVTVSVWGSWADLERATGGDTHHPIATRNMEQMVEWAVEHFEGLPNMERPRAPVSA
jgi:hypothetical protein